MKTQGNPPADFTLSPFIVLWELTRSCDLVCRHCRAQAQPERNPLELSTQEAFQVLEDLRNFHPESPRLLVLTGGDPLKRPDLFDLIAKGNALRFITTVTPSGTPSVTHDALRRMKQSGLHRLAISLDGATPETHDRFQGVTGSFASTLQILNWAQDLGIEIQINSSITRHTLADFDALAEICAKRRVALWSIFFLVPTGRGAIEDMAGAADFEAVFQKMAILAKTAPYDVKSTAAPQYRRVVWQTGRGHRRTPGIFSGTMRAPKAINDGNGILFISHTGEVFPSGFLPLSAGNVRREKIVNIYRHAPLFCNLRDYSQISGKCGACEFRSLCGGSRARAYAVRGNYLASDPYCVHVPRKYEGAIDIAH